ncbi:TetR/AcrR family transcriptional regulator [Aquihabitans daechungensis]|uniref:TetR/AcrR family transcriptional regulator n=1 Tax=Aquihabitans daechungensis TaxID=1052257 RepID=UPI003BA2BC72
MPTDTHVDEPIDGRTARAVRTKDAIVDATLALIDEGDLRPTGPRIAERAGVSVRSIFQHFDDLDALFSAVGLRVVDRIAGLIKPVDPAGPLDQRTAAFLEQRTSVLESLTPVLRAALVHAASSTVIRGQFENGHQFFVAQVDQVFAQEIAAAGAGGPTLRDGLVVALSWPSWDMLRGPQGRSVDEAREVAEMMVRALLASAPSA